MKKRMAGLIAILVFLIVGCSNNDFKVHRTIFRGQSPNFTGEFLADSTERFFRIDGTLHYQNKESTLLTITYKGELSDLASVKQVQIVCDRGTGISSLQQCIEEGDPPLFEKTFRIAGGGGNCALVMQDAVVRVTIDLDGKTETLDLKAIFVV